MIIPFKERLEKVNHNYITFDELQILQINVGNLCNLKCEHCHVSASSSSKKIMGRQVMENIADFLKSKKDIVLDITGGCPEMNPDFRYLIESTHDLSPRRILRTNLVIMLENGMEWLPEFCRDQSLVITASMPCYLEENVDRQRGKGVYAKSIAALKILNDLGYGKELELNLVYNPAEDFLPGLQKELEAAYKKELFKMHGIVFNSLFTITNAPIGRFKIWLEINGYLDRYLNLLSASFNPDAGCSIMCRNLLSVGWQGLVYNCDFNQTLSLPIMSAEGNPVNIRNLEIITVKGMELVLGQHCYCCTAGNGSSCSGSLAV